MDNGATCRARAMPGTAVLRIVVSSACMKNATATSHGNSEPEVGDGVGSGSALLTRSSRSAAAAAYAGYPGRRGLWRRCGSTVRAWEGGRHLAQPRQQLLHLRQLEVALGANEVVGAGAGQQLRARPHEAPVVDILRGERPARQREALALLGGRQHGERIIEGGATLAPIAFRCRMPPHAPGLIRGS